ncbi:MAG: hypothetical protein E7214_04635 [Clostridium sp.]|nr:hypothetical protein [Clostridium sp.]
MIICTIKGYEFFAGILSKKGIISSIIIVLIMVYISTHLSYGLEIYNAYKYEYDVTIIDCIRSVDNFLSDYDDIRSNFIDDLL